MHSVVIDQWSHHAVFPLSTFFSVRPLLWVTRHDACFPPISKYAWKLCGLGDSLTHPRCGGRLTKRNPQITGHERTRRHRRNTQDMGSRTVYFFPEPHIVWGELGWDQGQETWTWNKHWEDNHGHSSFALIYYMLPHDIQSRDEHYALNLASVFVMSLPSAKRKNTALL